MEFDEALQEAFYKEKFVQEIFDELSRSFYEERFTEMQATSSH